MPFPVVGADELVVDGKIGCGPVAFDCEGKEFDAGFFEAKFFAESEQDFFHGSDRLLGVIEEFNGSAAKRKSGGAAFDAQNRGVVWSTDFVIEGGDGIVAAAHKST